MRLWNTTALVEALARNEVAEREKVGCWLFLTVYYTLAIQNALWSCERVDAAGIIKGFLVLSVNVGGVMVCRRANKAADDSAFVDRFVCLSPPILLRIALALFVGGGLVALAARYWDGLAAPVSAENGVAATPELIFLTVGLEIAYYWWMREKFVAIGRLRSEICRRPNPVSPAAGQKGGACP